MDGEAMDPKTSSTATKYFNIAAQPAHPVKAYPIIVQPISISPAAPRERRFKTSRTKATAASDGSQYRLHWICSCNYRGFCTHTEFQPGVVEDLAQKMSTSGFDVTLEPLGLKDPIVDALTVFGLSLFVFLNNIVVDFKLAMLDSVKPRRLAVLKPTAEEIRAATIIQRAFRKSQRIAAVKWAARVLLWVHRWKYKFEELEAARTIQRAYRELQRSRKEMKAARVLQRAYRRRYRSGQPEKDRESPAWTQWSGLHDHTGQLTTITPGPGSRIGDGHKRAAVSSKLLARKATPYWSRPQQHAPQQNPTQQLTSQQTTAQAPPPPAHLPPSNTGANILVQRLPAPGIATGQRTPVPPPPPDLKYLLLCMKESEHLVSREDVEVSNLKFDQSVFQRIGTEYKSKRRKLRLGRLKAWLGIQRLLTISFVQGTVHIRPRFGGEPKLPRPRITFYDFKPRSPSLPPFDNNAMMHRFENPGYCAASQLFLEQMPKRKERRPDPGSAPDMFTGWGLYLTDGPHVGRLIRSAIAIYCMSFVASFSFGLVWSLVSPDKSVGDAWTVAVYISSIPLAGIGILAMV